MAPSPTKCEIEFPRNPEAQNLEAVTQPGSSSVGKLARRVGRKLLRAYNAHSPITRGKVRAVKILNPYLSELEPIEVAAVHSSIEMELDLREFVQRFIYYNLWEPHVTRVLLSLLSPGKTFFDIGSNVGYYTLLAVEAVGSRGSVHAFEANPRVFKLLHENVQRNRFEAAQLNNVALSDSNGSVQFCIDDLNPGSSSISGRGAQKVTRLTVPAVTLDTYIVQNDIEMVDVVKIDVEGAEVIVFKGGKRMLSRFRPDIVGEFSKAMMTRESGGEQEIVALLADLEYEAFILRANEVVSVPIRNIYETGESAPELFLTARKDSPVLRNSRLHFLHADVERELAPNVNPHKAPGGFPRE
jgi:FkbM family methyltransferase